MKIILKYPAFYLLIFFLLLLFFSPPNSYGAVYGVTCFDGSNHPPGFDCSSLIRGGSSGSSGGSTYQEPSYDWREQERLRKEIERQNQLRRQLQEAEKEAIQREKIAKEKFNIEKNKAVNSLKGTSSGTLQIKGSDLRTTFGIKTSPDVELKTPGGETRRITSAWKQLHCGAYISGFVIKKVTPKNNEGIDIEEVRYLTDQANKALSGSHTGVQCPTAPVPPKPYGKVALGSDSKLVRFYKKLLLKTEIEAQKVWKFEKEIWKIKANNKKVYREEAEKKQEVTKLKEEIKELEKTTPTRALKRIEKDVKEPEPKKKDTEAEEALEKKKRALKAALAALEKAKQAMAGVDKHISEAEKQRSNAKKKLSGYEEMFNKVKKEPALAKGYLGKMQK